VRLQGVKPFAEQGDQRTEEARKVAMQARGARIRKSGPQPATESLEMSRHIGSSPWSRSGTGAIGPRSVCCDQTFSKRRVTGQLLPGEQLQAI
jgi:hypothetical protein